MSQLPLHELALGIYRHSHEAMLVVDTQTLRIVEANAAACRLLGYAHDEITGQDVTEIESSIEYHFYWEEVKAGQRADIDSMSGLYRRRDGTTAVVAKRLVNFEVVGRALLLITFREIAVGKALGDELARSASLLKATLEATADGLLVTRTDGSISNMNHRFTRMWKIPDALLQAGDDGKILVYMRGCVADADDYQRKLQDAVLHPGRNAFDTLHLSDGRCFERYVTPLQVNGRASGHVFSFRDVSARVSSEAARRALEAQLRESQKMEAIGTLAGGIAHDFNNILAAILGNVSLARMDLASEHAALVSLDEIDKAGKRARNLVQQILTFSRKQTQTFLNQPLRPLVEESLGLMRAAVPAAVSLDATFTDVPLYANVDATQIGQVLMNLCTNAWQAMSGGAGRVAIDLDEVRFDAHAAQRLCNLAPGRYARLRVSDNGHGMDEATLARIFDPFYTTKPVGQGTGLGLAVVHGIVKEHRGAITVRSTPGRGTAFDVFLPIVAAAEAPLVSSTPFTPAAGQGKHVLYLDDDEAMLFLVKRMLQAMGYRVSCFLAASDALAAVHACGAGSPADFDLVVTDFNMPGASGLDVARDLTRIRPDLPVVITSGYITDELRAGALAAGVRHLLYKPNTVDELCATIQVVLESETSPLEQ